MIQYPKPKKFETKQKVEQKECSISSCLHAKSFLILTL